MFTAVLLMGSHVCFNAEKIKQPMINTDMMSDVMSFHLLEPEFNDRNNSVFVVVQTSIVT
jgi:hypothetical protein